MYNIKAFLNDISINKMCVLLEKIQPAKIYNKGDFIFHLKWILCQGHYKKSVMKLIKDDFYIV